MAATTSDNDMEKPECKLGYPVDQLERMLGDRLPQFQRWMRGQTMALCDGAVWDPAVKKYKNSGCGPHGAAIYPWDLRRYLDGKPVID